MTAHLLTMHTGSKEANALSLTLVLTFPTTVDLFGIFAKASAIETTLMVLGLTGIVRINVEEVQYANKKSCIIEEKYINHLIEKMRKLHLYVVP